MEGNEFWKHVWQYARAPIKICIYLAICSFVSFPIVKSYIENKIQCFNQHYHTTPRCDCSSGNPFDTLDCGYINYSIDFFLFETMRWFHMFIEAGIGIGPFFIFPLIGLIAYLIFLPTWYIPTRIYRFILSPGFEKIAKSRVFVHV